MRHVTCVHHVTCVRHVTVCVMCVQMFFEGIESKVASGVKEEEVGYQLAFSKQELRKVLKEYPGKEVCVNYHRCRHL